MSSPTPPTTQAGPSNAHAPHDPRCAQHPPIPVIVDSPPSYFSATMSSISNLGFPPGYFMIRSVANGRVFDIEENLTRDGTNVILWPEKDYSLVETLRNPGSDNQVFFIDAYGALCCRENGHAIDVERGRLVLRHRRPVTYPYPNAYSHPLPQFSYNPTTGVINVSFSCDPAFPQITRQNVQNLDQSWRQKSYILATLPERKQRTFVDDASEAIVGAFTNPLSLVGSFTASFASGSNYSQGGGSASEAGTTSEGDYDLRDDEVVEEERADAEEVDDSTALLRQVRVLSVDDPDAPLHSKTRDRRRWEVVPLRTSKAGWTR